MNMHWESYVFWGFASTLVLTTLMSASHGLGLTRMDLPLMLGTMFTSNRDRAKWLGFAWHFFVGWVFSFLYVVAFILTGWSYWWFGAMIGVVHGFFVLIVGMALLPTVHPRMATENFGPDPTHELEPPGFMALNYGRGTPTATLFAHVVYGAMLGLFYRH